MDEQSKSKLKEIFGVDDLRKITGEMIFNNTKQLYENADVSKEMWKSFSDFSGTTKDVIQCMQNYLDGVEKDNSKSTEIVYKACVSLLKNLDDELKNENITDKQKGKIYDKWLEVAKILKDVDLQNKEFHIKKTKIVIYCFGIISLAGLVCVAKEAIPKLLEKGVSSI